MTQDDNIYECSKPPAQAFVRGLILMASFNLSKRGFRGDADALPC